MGSITPNETKSRVTGPGTLRGACLCGSVAFELQVSHQYGRDRAMGFCHCRRCQRWSGGAGLPFVVAVPERFRVLRGQELIAHYRDDASTIRAFCRRCGSCLYQDLETTYYVGAGVLEDLTLTPGFHIYVTHKPDWEQIVGDAPQFAEMPTASGERHQRKAPSDELSQQPQD